MSDQNAIRIVVDTNLWISFCIGTKLSSLVEAIIQKRVVLCFSSELYDEIFDVLKRPQIQAIIKKDRVKELHKILADRVDIVSPSGSIHDCRDPKDNFLLELAISAHVDYLVTGDADLLALNPYQGLKIIKAQELEKILQTLG
jgi:hypothetical protein